MPVMITLNMIRKHYPCEDGWRKVLRGQGKTIADDVPFPIADILTSNDLFDTIWALRCLPDSTIAVEFAKGCAARAAAYAAADAADAAADAADTARAADAAYAARAAAYAADTARAAERDKQKEHLLELFNK